MGSFEDPFHIVRQIMEPRDPVPDLGPRPTLVGRRLLFAFLVFAWGAAATVVAWWGATDDRTARSTAVLSTLARESHTLLNARVEGHISALRGLARFWQIYGLLPEDAWRYDSEMLIEHFPGIVWVAWVNRGGTEFRFAASDSHLVLSEEALHEAKERAQRPVSEIIYPKEAGDPLRVFVPVRTPSDSVGVLAAALVPDELLGHASLGTSAILAYEVRSDSGEVVFRTGTPSQTVALSGVELELPQLFGKRWTVRYEPTDEFVQGFESPWANSFLAAGLGLALALGLTMFLLLGLRELRSELGETRGRLDARIQQLSDQDRELRKINEELEARVTSRTAELQEAVSELEAFSHSISHDLRSPIGAVLNYVAVLEEDFGGQLQEEGLRLLRRIRASGESATNLLDQLVQFAWVGREELVSTQVDMTAIAREASVEIEASLDGNGEVDLEVGPLPPARADAALIGRVFRNLLSNAVKFTRGREARRVEVTGESGAFENNYCVADNGIGFDPSLSDAIFEPFRRVHGTKQFEGSGLGLAIAAKIVRKHKGRIWAESDGSNGARFHFTLPKG